MKQKILSTIFGRLAMKIRDRVGIVKTALFKEEAAGTITNDWMATFLVTKLCQPNRSFIDVGAHIGSTMPIRLLNKYLSKFDIAN